MLLRQVDKRGCRMVTWRRQRCWRLCLGFRRKLGVFSTETVNMRFEARGLPSAKHCASLLLVVFASVFVAVTVLLPVHRCEHHHDVTAPIGLCHCACHSLSTLWHQGGGFVLLFCLIANAIFCPIVHQVLRFRRPEYRESLQRAPPILSY